MVYDIQKDACGNCWNVALGQSVNQLSHEEFTNWIAQIALSADSMKIVVLPTDVLMEVANETCSHPTMYDDGQCALCGKRIR